MTPHPIFPTMRTFLFSLIGLCIFATAIVSIQNAGAVSVTFLIWHSINLPLGIVLSLSFTVGLLLTVVIPPMWQMALFQDEFDEASFADQSKFEADYSQDWE
jgi:uncharacterized integral membrane protein